MAHTIFERARTNEEDVVILPNAWFVVRLDGKAFKIFAEHHGFEKPNDIRGYSLMNEAAVTVMDSISDIVCAYGQSDEYSFVFRRNTTLYSRRKSKLLTAVVSLFTGAYLVNWSKHFPDTTLKMLPIFDGRIQAYATDDDIQNYLAWRQTDCHLQNLYNTCHTQITSLYEKTAEEADNQLKGTYETYKIEFLQSQCNIVYTDLPALYRQGAVLVRKHAAGSSHGTPTVIKSRMSSYKANNVEDKPYYLYSTNICTTDFWRNSPYTNIIDRKHYEHHDKNEPNENNVKNEKRHDKKIDSRRSSIKGDNEKVLSKTAKKKLKKRKMLSKHMGNPNNIDIDNENNIHNKNLNHTNNNLDHINNSSDMNMDSDIKMENNNIDINDNNNGTNMQDVDSTLENPLKAVKLSETITEYTINKRIGNKTNIVDVIENNIDNSIDNTQVHRSNI